MNQLICFISLIVAQQVALGEELTLDQRLVAACYRLDVDTVVKCLRQGADVNARFGQSESDPFYNHWRNAAIEGAENWTPLLALSNAQQYPDPPEGEADLWRDEERARALKQKVPKSVLEKRQADATTILHILLSHNCRLDDDDGFGATALYCAVASEKTGIARVLLKSGANPNTKTQIYIDGPGDITPLHEAAGSRALMQMLIESGADVAAKDTNGLTPLDWLQREDDREFDLIQTANGWKFQTREKQE